MVRSRWFSSTMTSGSGGGLPLRPTSPAAGAPPGPRARGRPPAPARLAALRRSALLAAQRGEPVVQATEASLQAGEGAPRAPGSEAEGLHLLLHARERPERPGDFGLAEPADLLSQGCSEGRHRFESLQSGFGRAAGPTRE